MLSNLPNKTVIGGRWETTGLIGAGACAQVYKVRAIQSAVPYEVVAKVVPFAKGKSKADKQQERICNTLNYEYVMYNGALCEFPQRPRTPEKFYGDDKVLGVRYLVMEQMERDLIAVSNSPKEVNSSNIARLGLQILDGLRWIHQKGYLFIDVKPDNFMMKGDSLYFVDFGLLERLTVVNNAPKREFAGTPTFCSVAAHSGEHPAACDDLEALGLVLLSLTSNGRLPWSTAKSDAECLEMKRSCDVRKLCAAQGVPEVADVILTSRNAARTVRPDYDALRAMLTKMRDRKVAAVPKASAASSSSAAPTKPLTAAQKRAAAQASATATVDVPLSAAAVDLRESSASPAPKKSRRAQTAPVEDIITSLSAVSTTESAVGSEKSAAASSAASGKASAASKATAKAPRARSPAGKNSSGPFSPSFAAVEELSSPVTRSKSRLSSSSVHSDAPAGGPFSYASPRGKTTPSTSKPAVESAPTFLFTVVKGPCKNMTFEMYQPSAAAGTKRRGKGSAETVKSVGRDDDCDFSLAKDQYLSGRHFELIATSEGLFLRDSGATNQTSVNGLPSAPGVHTLLRDGDVITAGKTGIRVQALA